MNMLARSSQSAKRCDVPLILIYFSSRLSRKREPTCVVRGHGGRGGRGGDRPADRWTHLPRRRPSLPSPPMYSVSGRGNSSSYPPARRRLKWQQSWKMLSVTTAGSVSWYGPYTGFGNRMTHRKWIRGQQWLHWLVG